MHTTLTPLFDAIEGLRRQDFSRFHTPGHKGAPLGFLSAVTPWDFTEVRGADSLFEAEGPIAETERLYTELYGTAGSFLSAGGSTLCIQAMLRLVQPLGQKILIGRNAHGSAVSAMALLGLEPAMALPSDPAPTCSPPPSHRPRQRKPCAGIPMRRRCMSPRPTTSASSPTSPDWRRSVTGTGYRCWWTTPTVLSCSSRRENRHPMHLGADLCCDSLHKTLPVAHWRTMLHVGDTP